MRGSDASGNQINSMKIASAFFSFATALALPSAHSQSTHAVAAPSASAKTGSEAIPQVNTVYFVAGGLAFVSRNGVSARLTGPTTLRTGTKISSDGVVTMPDGRRFTLRPGQILTATGDVVNLAPKPLPYNLASRPLEGILMSNGRAYLVRAGRMERMGSAVRLRSGVIVEPTGRLRMPDGTSSQLGNGQLVTFRGQIRNPGNNPAGNSPVASYPRNADTPTTGTSQATFTGEVAPNAPQLPGSGSAAN